MRAMKAYAALKPCALRAHGGGSDPFGLLFLRCGVGMTRIQEFDFSDVISMPKVTGAIEDFTTK